MLRITLPAINDKLWNEQTEEFVFVNEKEQTLCLEHSLVSLSKWESKWCKPFLTKEEKTEEEALDYIKCMTLTQNVDPKVYSRLTAQDIKTINEYIAAPMTATWFSDDNKAKPSREQITSELVYYWMIALNIPFECQKWHFNRLLTLVKVCNVKNQDPKKSSKREVMNRNRALNEARKKQLNTKG